jgi:hypothetical protein
MHVRFATPCLTHTVSAEYLLSALRTQKLFTDERIAHDWSTRPGDPFIAKARSSIVADFLESDATDLFFLDDDIGWPAEAALKLIRSDAPVIAGVYPHKMEEVSWPCSLEAEGPGLVEKDGLYRAVLAPTGFMRIKRWVLQKLYEAGPAYRETEADGRTFERRAVFLEGPGADGNWWGEDYAFCNACRAAGIDVWIDPDINFFHRGTKRWAGNMAPSIGVFESKARMRATTSEAA